MFWRKKKADGVQIELDETPREAAERRDSFRIGSDPEHPVIVTVGGVEHPAASLSAGGLAIRAPGLQAGGKYSIRLQLPDGSPVILIEVEVTSESPQGLRHCKFLKLSASSRSVLHRYILSREKQQIRNTRTRKAVIIDGE